MAACLRTSNADSGSSSNSRSGSIINARASATRCLCPPETSTALAYLISASACVVLIGFYVCHVLRSVAHGLGFSAGLAALYGLLYGLLSAEDYALLMGSLLLFGLLGTVMVLTRKLDWYGVGKRKVEQGQ